MTLFNEPGIVILTGAGISAESGIRTFRASDGLWETHRIEDVATPEAFVRDPALVHTFYNARRSQLLDESIKPNAAHRALGELERALPAGEVLVVTQNIDNLHERGGSRQLLHMHGELLKAHCVNTREVFEIHEDLAVDSQCACCRQAGTLRPHIVWFGEIPMHQDVIYPALAACHTFVSIGTSGNVYPAAGFVNEAKAHGAHAIEINIDESNISEVFDEHRVGPASQEVPRWVRSVTARAGAD